MQNTLKFCLLVLFIGVFVDAKITLGVVLPLSGPLSLIGSDLKNGLIASITVSDLIPPFQQTTKIELKHSQQKQSSETGLVDFVFQDDQGNSTLGALEVMALTSTANISAVMTSYVSASSSWSSFISPPAHLLFAPASGFSDVFSGTSF